MSALEQIIPQGYRQAEVGIVPEDWSTKPLVDLVNVIDGDRGHNYPSANDFHADGHCVFLSATNVTKNGFSFREASFITKEKDTLLRKGKLKRNDIVLTTRGSVGQYAFYDDSVIYEHLRINSGMVLIRLTSDDVKPDYLYNVLKSQIVNNQISTMSFGSAQPQLTVRGINNFFVCYPSDTKEQTAIANALSDVDALLTELEKLIAKKQAIKTATMQQLLTGKTRLPQFATFTEGSLEGKSQGQPKGTKPSELGEIPEDWKVQTVDEQLKLLTDFEANGSFESVAQNVSIKDNDGYAWYVRATDLENSSRLSKVKYVDAKSYSFLKKTSLYGDELLITKRGEIGKVYFFEMKTEHATLAPNMYLLKLNENVCGKFLYYFFKSDIGQKLLKKNNASTSLGALYKDDVKSMLIALPSELEEQTAVSTIISDMDNEIQTLEQRLAKTRQIKQGMMQELLTGRTRLPYDKS